MMRAWSARGKCAMRTLESQLRRMKLRGRVLHVVDERHVEAQVLAWRPRPSAVAAAVVHAERPRWGPWNSLKSGILVHPRPGCILLICGGLYYVGRWGFPGIHSSMQYYAYREQSHWAGCRCRATGLCGLWAPPTLQGPRGSGRTVCIPGMIPG